MHIISRSPLMAFGIKCPDAGPVLKVWYDDTKRATWKTPQDITNRYPHASFVGNNRVVFNLKGNAYRLAVAVEYRYRVVYIKFIASHADYDKIDAATVEMESFNERKTNPQ